VAGTGSAIEDGSFLVVKAIMLLKIKYLGYDSSNFLRSPQFLNLLDAKELADCHSAGKRVGKKMLKMKSAPYS